MYKLKCNINLLEISVAEKKIIVQLVPNTSEKIMRSFKTAIHKISY